MSKINIGIASVSVDKLPYKYNECEPLAVNLKLLLANLFTEFAANGNVSVITNAEYGVPLWCGEIASALRLVGNDISLCVVPPHDNQTLTWYEDWHGRYYVITENADRVSKPDLFYTLGCKEMCDFYEACDRFIVDNCDLVIAITAGGELPYMARYARSIGLPVMLVNADNLSTTMQTF